MKIDRFPLYEFHEEGFVISYTRKEPFVMKPIKMGEYKGLQLKRDDDLIEKIYLHRAIAEAAYGPCPDDMQCRHLDGNKENNCSSNLKWGTPSQNNNDKNLHGTALVGENNPMSKLTNNSVAEMRKHRLDTGDSYKKLGKKFGVSTMTAFRAVTGQSWRHHQ